MTLPIYLYGHPVLRRPTEEITAEYPDLERLIANMWETMYHSEGVGLAAPQVGKSIRLIVIDGTPMADTDPMEVKRTEHIRLRWLDENFQPHEQEFEGFLCRIIQHEYDHLEGKVYMDRVSPIRRTLLKSKLSALVKGRVKCDYKVVAAPKTPFNKKY